MRRSSVIHHNCCMISVVSDDEWRAWPDGREHVAFVLGAGFSRAISELMPLTDELGLAALAKLRPGLPARLALDQFPRGLNFEAWLSQLAGDQPYLSVADNAENRVAFLRFSEAIAQILGERVNGVLANHYPEWLLELLSAAHHTRATLITFNYDTLIECLVATPTGILGNPNEYGEVWQGVSWTELTGGLPPWAPGDARLASSRVESVRLLKLHGLLNWYWQPGYISGISVARRPLPGLSVSPCLTPKSSGVVTCLGVRLSSFHLQPQSLSTTRTQSPKRCGLRLRNASPAPSASFSWATHSLPPT
jgi:hypothetical protein